MPVSSYYQLSQNCVETKKKKIWRYIGKKSYITSIGLFIAWTYTAEVGHKAVQNLVKKCKKRDSLWYYQLLSLKFAENVYKILSELENLSSI